MSALDGWIDVCRAGTWRDMGGREVTIGQDNLDRIAAAYATADPAPVVVGHPETDTPAYGWVEGVRRVGDRLQAKLRDIAPEFRAAVEAGRYASRSVALHGDTLRHVGFLGGAAPAVSGLAPTRFAVPAETVAVFAAAELAGPEQSRWAWGALARVLRGLRERIVASDGIEAADRALPDHEIDTVSAAAAAGDDETMPAFAAAADAGETSDDTTPEDDMSGKDKSTAEAELAAKEAELDEGREALARDRAALEERKARLAAEERTRSADTTLEAHVKAGRVLPAERPRLAALMAALPDGEEDVIAFAAGEDGATKTESPRAAFEAFLASLPSRVPYGELAGGPPLDAATGDPDETARRAREYQEARLAAGEPITATKAVDAVIRGADRGAEAS